MDTIIPRPKLLCSTISPFRNCGAGAAAVAGVTTGRIGFGRCGRRMDCSNPRGGSL